MLNLCHNCDCTCFGCRVSVTYILLRLTAALLGAGAALLALNPVVVVIALRDQLSCVSPNVPEGSMKPEQPCCLETVGSCRARIELRLLLVKLFSFFFFSPTLSSELPFNPLQLLFRHNLVSEPTVGGFISEAPTQRRNIDHSVAA